MDSTTGQWQSEAVGSDRGRAEELAEAKADAILNDEDESRLRRTTWADFATEHVSLLNRPSTKDDVERMLKEFGEVCHPKGPRNVSFTMIERYVTHLRTREKPNTQATINKKLRYLKAALNKAIKRRYIRRNAMMKWDWTKADERIVREVTTAEETAILDACETLYGDRWVAFVKLALATGARRSELLRLSWDKVKFDTLELVFTRTKGKKDRVMPITQETADLLRAIQPKTLADGGPFIDMANGVNKRWERIRTKAGCEDVCLHDLRKTFVSRAIRSGGDVDLVRRMAGHSDSSVTMTYYRHVRDSDMRRAIEKMSQGAVA